MRGAQAYTLWIEQIAERLGFDQVSRRLFDDDTYAPYLFVLAVVIFDVPILSTIPYLVHDGGYHPLLDLPAWPMIPLALLIGVFGMRTIRSRYAMATATAGRSSDEITVSPPTWFQTGLYGAVVTIYLLYYLPGLPSLLAMEGPVVGSIKYLFIIPGVYFVVLSDFLAVYLHGLFLLPLAIARQDVPLDFSKRYGGMEDVGSLLIVASTFYFVTLALWTGSTILNSSALSLKSFLLHSIMWGTGILLFASSLWIVHRHMARQKQQQLAETRAEIQRSGTDDEMFPYVTPHDEVEATEYVLLYVKFDRIERTRTYPMNPDRLIELTGAVLAPVVLQAISLTL